MAQLERGSRLRAALVATFALVFCAAGAASAKDCGHFYICSQIHCACGDTVIQNYTLNANNPSLVDGVLDCSTSVGLKIAGSRCADASATFTCNTSTSTCNDGPLAGQGCEADADCRVAACVANKCSGGADNGKPCGVVFNGGGNTIRGPGTHNAAHYGIAFENATGVASQRSTATNVAIEGYNHGVKLHSSRHNTVEDVTATGLGNLATGSGNLDDAQNFGISLRDAKFETVRTSTVEAYLYGVNFLRSDRNKLDAVTTSRNGNFVDVTGEEDNHVGYGIRVEGADSDSDYNLIADCTVENNADEGIHLGTGVTGNVLDGGTYRDNVVENIYVLGADGNEIRNVLTESDATTCTGVRTPKLCCSGTGTGCGSVSLYIENSSENLITGSLFNDDAVQLWGSSEDNTFDDNVIDGATLRFEALAGRPTGNIVTGGSIEAPSSAAACVIFDESYGNVIDMPDQEPCGLRNFLTATTGHCRVKPTTGCNFNIDCGECCGNCALTPFQACCTDGGCPGSGNFCNRSAGHCQIAPAVSCTANSDCRICDPTTVYPCSGNTCAGGPENGQPCAGSADCNFNTYKYCDSAPTDFTPVSPPAVQSTETALSDNCP